MVMAGYGFWVLHYWIGEWDGLNILLDRNISFLDAMI